MESFRQYKTGARHQSWLSRCVTASGC